MTSEERPEETSRQVDGQAGSVAGSDARLRAVMDAIQTGIVVLDLEARILETNAAFRDIMGYDEEELRGLALLELLVPRDAERTMKMLAPLRTGESDRVAGRCPLMRRDRIVLGAHAVGTLVRDAEGKPLEIILLLEDVSETVQIPHRMD